MLENLCSPALMYVVFSMTQVIIDIFKNLYQSAMVKFVIMCIFTLFLQILCERGLGVISWFIVFIPFITMTFMTTLILYSLGFDSSHTRVSLNDNPRKKKQVHTNNKEHQHHIK
jgi:archaellum biogenesis protein FlaJ (TadC family)